MSELALTLIRQAKQQRLTRLELGRCGLTELPDELFELTWLEELILSDEWWEWDNTHQEWKEYQSNNQGKKNIISALPQALQQLTSLKKLVAAGTRQTTWQIQDLSPLAGLTNFTQLYLSSNQLTELRPLAGLTNLTLLYLRNNTINDLSCSIALLKKGIPIRLNPAFTGNEIAVGENPLIHPPVEIVEQGNQAVLDYFDALAKGTAYLNEAKLIIVGEPAAGKTSLMECLWNPAFELIPEADSKSTLGVDVREGWEFPHPEFNEVTFTTNIWDFGGQHIQYMTHQFFLTPNAVYVLVSANDRKESTNFPYWFKIINLLGQDEGRYSPVIVVLNEKDRQFIHKFNFDKAAIECQYPHIPLQVCEVNLDKTKRGAKFEVLKQTIQEALTNLPLVKNVKPAAWQPIREALRKRAKRDAHINLDAYVRICKKHGVTEQNQQLLFLRYLHRLGSLLHFANDETLADFIILNPQWAVDAVYCVIADKTIVANNGYFKRSQVDTIWASKKHKNGAPKYNQAEQNKLFNLMKKDNFEICYALKDRPNEFIAPQLLATERPNYQWDDKQNLRFRYQYEFMPQGIIARLIVRLSHLLKKQDGCDVIWRQGMLLEDSETQCNALIQEDEIAGLKVIDIAINGNPHQRKYLLYDIRKALNDLHKRWFSNIKVEEMIPCNCRECSTQLDIGFYFKFSALKTAQERGKSVKECDQSCIDVPIMNLLEGIYQTEEIKYMSNDKMHSAPTITNHFYEKVERIGQGTNIDQSQHNAKTSNISTGNITMDNNSQLTIGNNNVQKQHSDNYTHTQTLTVEQRQQLSELIKALRNMELSDEEMDIVDAARQLVRADEKQSTPATQGKLVKLFNQVKDWMDLSNNTIGVVTAITPVLPQLIHSIAQAVN